MHPIRLFLHKNGFFANFLRDRSAFLKRIFKKLDWKRLAGKPLQHKVIDNVKYTALYVGIVAGKDGILGRFK